MLRTLIGRHIPADMGDQLAHALGLETASRADGRFSLLIPCGIVAVLLLQSGLLLALITTHSDIAAAWAAVMWAVAAASAAAAALFIAHLAWQRRQLHVRRREIVELAELSSCVFWQQDADLRFTIGHSWRVGRVRIGDGMPLGKRRDEIVIVETAEEQAQLDAHVAALGRREAFADFVYRTRFVDGRLRYIQSSGKPVFGPDGRFQGYTGVARDVTRLIAAEKQREAERTRVLAAINSVGDAISFWDADDRFVYCNERYREYAAGVVDLLVAGNSYRTLLTAYIDRGIVPLTGQAGQDWIAKRLAAHRRMTKPVTTRIADRWLMIDERIMGDGSWLMVAADVTELRRREAELRAALDRAAEADRGRAQFLAAIDNVADAICLWDAEDRFVHCNLMYREQSQGAGALLVPGITLHDYLRRSVELGLIGDAIGREQEWLDMRFSMHRHMTEPLLLRRADKWLLISERILPDGSLLVLASNVTMLREQQDLLQKAIHAADEANVAKSRFLAAMSHELRTPLNAILGYAEVIRDQVMGPALDRYSSYAGDIHSSGAHLLSIINDLLDTARIDTRDLDLATEPTEAAALVRDCVAMVRPQSDVAGVAVTQAVATDLPPLLIDRKAIRQILLNLLSNALRFTPAGGRIAITVTRGPDDGAVFEVADSGSGIAAAEMPHLFEPFHRRPAEVRSDRHGTGLGLPICRGLIELHGGSIGIDSAPGQGARVRFTLPPDRVCAPSMAGAAA
jgi:signal transduction histidine kinase